ncbi:hypothetical protein ACQKKK_03075 [Peribacillus sp. NPDC006672]|uniref:hypothetical protein n=1 Tax=Peribacillus sp. NPDC006672 TaxID=3390606 RepID=UPI003D07FDFB
MIEVLYPGKSAPGNDEQRWIAKWTDVLPIGLIVQQGNHKLNICRVLPMWVAVWLRSLILKNSYHLCSSIAGI